METIEILTSVCTIMMGIIVFFLKQTMSELKDVKETAYRTQTRVEVMEIKFSNVDEKFEDLKDAVKELTLEIKNLNKKIKD